MKRRRQWVTEIVAVIPDAPNPAPIDFDTPQRQEMRRKERSRRRRARMGHYFWLPCPLCGMFSGGHEWKGHNSSIPVEPDNPHCSMGHGICPACTTENRGWAVNGYCITREVRR